MITYGYRCAWCGPFEKRANPRSAGAPAICPGCGFLSARTYGAPAARSPRRTRELAGAGKGTRARIDRAEAGTPLVGRPPTAGRHLHGLRPPPPRPWQVGH